MKKIVMLLIQFYQKTFSPDHSEWGKMKHPYGYCKFYPSCSEYAKQAIIKYGLLRGFVKAFWRVLRCNPWSKGGIDQP